MVHNQVKDVHCTPTKSRQVEPAFSGGGHVVGRFFKRCLKRSCSKSSSRNCKIHKNGRSWKLKMWWSKDNHEFLVEEGLSSGEEHCFWRDKEDDGDK